QRPVAPDGGVEVAASVLAGAEDETGLGKAARPLRHLVQRLDRLRAVSPLVRILAEAKERLWKRRKELHRGKQELATRVGVGQRQAADVARERLIGHRTDPQPERLA